MSICDNIEEHEIKSFYGEDYNAVVLTEGSQIGTVNYDSEW